MSLIEKRWTLSVPITKDLSILLIFRFQMLRKRERKKKILEGERNNTLHIVIGFECTIMLKHHSELLNIKCYFFNKQAQSFDIHLYLDCLCSLEKKIYLILVLL
jgi:hypothetical protein